MVKSELIPNSWSYAAQSLKKEPAKIVRFEGYKNRIGLQKEIDYFDNNFSREELPQDWYDINDVGFSFQKQMNLLDKTKNPLIWSEQTARDLSGFALEYLMRRSVLPFEYEIEGKELIDRKYGGRKMLDMVNPNERGGAVFDSLSMAQEHLLREGTTAIMVSPPGKTNLKTDDGLEIMYYHTQIFHMRNIGGKVIGNCLRVDFDLEKAKEVIKSLTGKELPKSASSIDCARAVFLSKDENQSPQNLVNILKNIKESKNTFGEQTWEDMEKDLERRELLYEFDDKTKEIINEFKNYATFGNHSRLEMQKALAATFLKISRYFMDNKRKSFEFNLGGGSKADIFPAMTYGQVVGEVKKIPGCAGGGGVTSVTSIRETAASIKNREYKFDQSGPCRLCGEDVPCGPCQVCESCNDKIDQEESLAQAA